MKRRLGLAMAMTVVVVLLSPLSNAFAAQDAEPLEKPSPREVNHTASATDLTLGLAYQGPTQLTGSATLMWGRPTMLVAWAPGKLAQLRVGARGAQLSLGFVAGAFEESPLKPSGVAVTLKAIVIRTWRDPSDTANGHVYSGLESDIVLLGIRGSIGYARKVSGRGGPDDRLVWSLGLGL